MQVASWLLLERALREQDMTFEVAARARRKVVLDMQPNMHNDPSWYELPERFRSLSEESWRFINRARHMNREASCLAMAGDTGNPVNEQCSGIRNAFDSGQKP